MSGLPAAIAEWLAEHGSESAGDDPVDPPLALQLRTIADRLDPEGAPRRTNLSFTFEKYRGIVVDMEGRRGCPLWYYGMADYERAHTEAVSPS